MMSSCKRCGDEIPTDEVEVKCYGQCCGFYHITCSGLSMSTYRKKSESEKRKWVCVNCRGVNKVLPTAVQEEDGEEEAQSIKYTTGRKIKLTLEGKIDLLLAQQTSMSEQLEKVNDRLEEYRTEINELKDEIKSRDLIIEKLNQGLNELQQQARSRFFEIHNAPQIDKETEGQLKDVIKKTVAAFDVLIDDDEIESFYRLPTRNPKKPRPIIVELFSRRRVQNVISNRRKQVYQKEALNLGADDEKIYINESLSKWNKELLFLTKKKASEKGFQYVWARNGKIYIRKKEGSEAIQITSLNQLNKI